MLYILETHIQYSLNINILYYQYLNLRTPKKKAAHNPSSLFFSIQSQTYTFNLYTMGIERFVLIQ